MASRPALIDPEVALEHWQAGRAQLVDARPWRDYRQSRERVPEAIHIEPGTGAAESEALLALPREKLIIAYCDEPGQAASAEIARRVRALGIGDGCALAGGFRAWKEAGFPTELGPPLASPARAGEAPASHVIERATGAVSAAVRAPSLAALFEEAALALADAIGVPRPGVERTDQLFAVRARDSEALLLVFLNELLARTVAERRLFVAVEIQALADGELRARARGAEVAAWHLELRADALPEVGIERRPGGFEARLTLAV